MHWSGVWWYLAAVPTSGLAACVGGMGQLTATEVDCGMMTPAVEVDIVDYAFEPDEVSLQDGDVVRWTNMGDDPHTVTSGNPGDDEAGSMFDSGELQPGDTFCLQVNGSGVATYYCALHPEQMRDARLEVGDGGGWGGLGGY